MVLKTVEWWAAKQMSEIIVKLTSTGYRFELTLRRQSLHVVVVQLEGSVAALAREAHHVVGIVVHLGADLAQRQVHTANVVDHEDIALNDLQLHVVLSRGTLHTQQHGIRLGCYETQCDVVLLGVGLRALRIGVLHHALVAAKFIGNGLCNVERNNIYEFTPSGSQWLLTVIAGGARVGSHVAFAGVGVPLLDTDSAVRTRILAALGGSLTAADHQGAGHHSIAGQRGRRVAQIQRRQAALKARPRGYRARQLGVHILEYSSNVQDASQLEMHIVSSQGDDLERVVHGQGVGLRARSSYADLMPAIVIHVNPRLIAHRDRPVAQIEGVVYMPIDQLHGHKVVASPPIEDQQAIRLDGLEAEVYRDTGIGLQHGQAHIGVLRPEGGCMIRLAGRRVHKSSCQLEGGTGQSR